MPRLTQMAFVLDADAVEDVIGGIGHNATVLDIEVIEGVRSRIDHYLWLQPN